MSNEIRSLILKRLQRDEKKQDNITVTKCVTVGIDNANDCSVTSRPGFIWVKENFQGGAIFQAFNSCVKPLVGLQVLVSRGYDAAYRRVVIGVDWDAVVDNYYTGVPYDLVNHASTHEWQDTAPGIDAISVYPRSVVPFRVYPKTGIAVGVAKGYYVIDTVTQFFSGEASKDLSIYLPSVGNSIGLLLYFDLSDFAVHVSFGAEVASPSEPTYPSLPNGAFQLCYIKLIGGMTQISESNIIQDLRPMFTFSSNSSMLNEIAILAEEIDFELSRHIVNG